MKIQTCYCGTNHDAFDTAMRMAKQVIKYHHDGADGGEHCILWIGAVAMAFSQIATQMVGLAIEAELEDKDGTFEQKRSFAIDKINRMEAVQVLALEDNPNATKALAAFICDDCGVPADRAAIERGPSPHSVAQAKLDAGLVEPASTPLMDMLRKMFGNSNVHVVSMDDEDAPPVDRSKAH